VILLSISNIEFAPFKSFYDYDMLIICSIFQLHHNLNFPLHIPSLQSAVRFMKILVVKKTSVLKLLKHAVYI